MDGRFSACRAGIRLATAQCGGVGDVGKCLRERTVDLLAARGPGRTICPSEVARACALRLGRRWQDLMPQVRAVAQVLVAEGVLEAIQHEAVVVLHEVHGPVRLRLRRDPPRAPAA
jgi:hypothetical protein